MARYRTGASFIAMSLLVLLGLAGCRGTEPAPATKPAAALNPQRQRLIREAGLDGRVALVQFGLVVCERSGKELDIMRGWHEKKSIPGLTFVRVENHDAKEEVNAYLAENPIPFHVQSDPRRELAQAFDCTAWPRCVLLDRFGRVRYRGPLPEETLLTEWTNRLTAEKADVGGDVMLVAAAQLDVAKLLADTKLPSLDQPARPLKEYVGKTGMLLLFVDTTCPFSQAAAGELPTVAQAYAKQGLTTVVVNLDEAEGKVRKHYAGQQPAPVVFDVTPATRKTWAIQAVPTAVVVSAGEKLVYNGKAIWGDIAAMAEKELGLPAGSLKVEAQGTGFG